jgi:hypothetical protein
MSADPIASLTLDDATAARYLAIGLDHIEREYPNHPGHLLRGPDDRSTPAELHPIFYGSFDWHSSVHMHWMLLRVASRYPDLADVEALDASFARRITPDNVEVEVRYLDEHPWFERPYGWAWLLTLAAELDRQSSRFAAILEPLSARVRTACLDWLAGVPHPQRSGTHGNSAFAAGLIHDAATAGDDAELATAVADAAARWYPLDQPPAPWLEPSSTDFLSPTLTLVDLRRRLLAPGRFAAWVVDHLAGMEPLLQPVAVTDRDDPQLVHLDGLNLSRATHLTRLAAALQPDSPLTVAAARAADEHAAAALPAVLHGTYVGSHWLPTFAVALLDARDDAARSGTDV